MISFFSRYLHLPPHNRTINLMWDADFQQANTAFKGVLRVNKQAGNDTSKTCNTISPDDLDKLYEDHLNFWQRCPVPLQQKVWFDIMYYMGKRGQEGIHKFTINSFAVGKTSKGHQYIYQTFNQVTKKNQGDNTSVSSSRKVDMDHVMFELPGDEKRCPLKSFQFYISKLHQDYGFLWQWPNVHCRYPDKDHWYDKMKVGEHSMRKWMKELSITYDLSQEYTNHCMRKTCTTALAKLGFVVHKIASITKHASLESLKSYIKTPTIDEH